MKKLKCLRCDYRWTPRTKVVPVSCPACKSYKWNIKRGVKK